MVKKKCSKLCPRIAYVGKSTGWLWCSVVDDWKLPGDKCEAREDVPDVPKAVVRDGEAR